MDGRKKLMRKVKEGDKEVKFGLVETFFSRGR